VGTSSSCQAANNEADSVFTLVFFIRAPLYSRGFFFVTQEVTSRMKRSANAFSSSFDIPGLDILRFTRHSVLRAERR
jgi:hypothetical protein